jgi:hypothetical protein
LSQWRTGDGAVKEDEKPQCTILAVFGVKKEILDSEFDTQFIGECK